MSLRIIIPPPPAYFSAADRVLLGRPTRDEGALAEETARTGWYFPVTLNSMCGN